MELSGLIQIVKVSLNRFSPRVRMCPIYVRGTEKIYALPTSANLLAGLNNLP